MAALLNPVAPAPLPIRLIGRMVDWTVIAIGGAMALLVFFNVSLHLIHLDLAWVEEAFEAGRMDRPHLDGIRSRVLRNISSIAFAGADRRTAVLGCLLDDRLATLKMPLAGVPPIHWNHP